MLEFHTGPPGWAATATGTQGVEEGPPALTTRFHAKKLSTQLTLHNGATRLLASWTPTGKPEFAERDTRVLVFLVANLHLR